ncbi:17514_t:CDS:2 [Acaulospora morrowiae]|uniref:GPI inositol-deacylase n=1 Tax=Acaulospora morrowiae TaxID=94023 RepID=A0A9N8YUN4_9GLOM|nr:17514_t:CDS:2 [Acaulospora morrowiae]
MGVREAEGRETLEIKSRYEVDTTRLIDPVPSVDCSGGKKLKGRTPSPTSPEKLSLQGKNHTTASASVVSPSKKLQKPSATTSMQSPSALSSCSYPIMIILFITVILLGVTFDSFLYYQKDPIGCEVSYMYPTYLRQDGFDSEQTRFAGKYGLYLYRDSSYDRNDQPIGIPALFIPGNAGSYRQVRAIASETSKIYYENRSELWNDGLRPIDFFTVDFNEELSAFHGHSLLEQAEYLNDAIRYILSLYPLARKNLQTDPSSQVYPDPTAVIIIGHSMGGVVARTLFTMPNYQPGSINTILTMASPHLLPPAPFDWQISKIYKDINEFWKNGYSQNSTENSLDDVTLISIVGGNLDTVVCSDSANISPLVPASNGFTVFTTSIPNVWTAMDHQCILWCNQLVGVVANSLLSVVDVRRAVQTKLRSERMSAFRKVLLTGLEEHAEQELNEIKREPFGIINLEKLSHRFLDMGQRLVLSDAESTPQVYLMPIPPSAPHSALNAFSFLTGQSLFEDSGLSVLLCHVMPTEVPEPHGKKDFSLNDLSLPTAPRLSCQVVHDDVLLVPASTFEVDQPFSGQTFNFLKLKVEKLGDYQYIVVMFRKDFAMKGFLIGEFYDERTSMMEVNTTIKDLLWDGIHIDIFPEHNTLVSTLRIPVIESSLLTYKISVRRNECAGKQLFAPFLRQSISSMYESKFLVNFVNADLNTHGQAPFITPVTSPHFKKGIELQFWMDPTCSAPMSVDIELDLYGSFGKMVMRFQTILVVFPFITIVMTLRAQLREYNRGEPFPSFVHGLALFIRQTLPKFLIAVSILSVYQSIIISSKTHTLVEHFIMGYAPEGLQKAIVDKVSFDLNDTLLGNQDPFFWFLPLIFIFVSIGVTTIFWLLLEGIIRMLVVAAAYTGRDQFTTKPAKGTPESKKSKLRRRSVTTAILFILVSSFVPYQFAFVVAFLVHVVSCVRSLIVARKGVFEIHVSLDLDLFSF